MPKRSTTRRVRAQARELASTPAELFPVVFDAHLSGLRQSIKWHILNDRELPFDFPSRIDELLRNCPPPVRDRFLPIGSNVLTAAYRDALQRSRYEHEEY